MRIQTLKVIFRYRDGQGIPPSALLSFTPNVLLESLVPSDPLRGDAVEKLELKTKKKGAKKVGYASFCTTGIQ